MTYDPITPSWKQKSSTDRQTGAGRACLTLVLYLLPLLKRKVKHWLCSTLTPHPTHSSVCGNLTPARGSPKAALLCFSFTLVCSWQLHALFPPLASSQSSLHLLAPTRTFYLISRTSIPQSFWGSSFSGFFSLPCKGLSAQDMGLTLMPHSP